MSNANTINASSKAGSHISSNKRKTQGKIRNRSLRPVHTTTTASLTDLPDVDQLRRARTEVFGRSPIMRRTHSNREVADIVDSRLQQAGPREASRRSYVLTEHESPRRQHGKHRHRRKSDPEDEDREIVYVYRNSGTAGSSRANIRSQDRLPATTGTTTRRSRSTRSNNQRSESRSLFSRRATSLVDVVSRPLADIAEGGRDTSRSYERLIKRPTTRKRHSERSRHLTEQPRVTRYDRHMEKGSKILTISGARRCTKDPYRPLALRLLEVTQLYGRRDGACLSLRRRDPQSGTKSRM